MAHESQYNCEGSFKGILQQRSNPPSEYDRTDVRRAPGSDYTAAGCFTLAVERNAFIWSLPLILRVLPFLVIPPIREITWPYGKLSNQLKRTGPNPVEGSKVAVKEWATGSSNNLGSECGTHRKPDTRTDESSVQTHTSIPSNRRSVAASRVRVSNRPKVRPNIQGELKLKYHKRLCEKCGKNEAYWSASWCSDCIWKFVKE